MKTLFIVIFLFSTSVAASSLNLTQQLKAIEYKTSGRLGVAILNTNTNELWSYKGSERFPLLSTFKTLACAKMLSDIEKGNLEQNSETLITRAHLVTWSPISTKSLNKSMSVFKACEATMLISDNTAANIVLSKIGGPEGLTQFLRDLGDSSTRLDRIEPELNSAIEGDYRDTTTPIAMVKTMNTLLYGKELGTNSKAQLIEWMTLNKVSGALLRSVLPQNWKIADRTGSGGNGSRAIVATIWKPDTKPYIITIYLTGKKMKKMNRNKIIAEVGSEIFEHYSVE